MPCKILTPDVVGIDALLHDHQAVLAKSAGGAVAVFANNAPAFYAVTPARLAELLALEEKLSRPGSDITLDAQFYEEPQAAPVAVPMGKFPMYADWQPDADFQRQAALWGIALREPVTAEELAAFVAYWQAEGRSFTMFSGSKNSRVAYKLAGPAMAECPNVMLTVSANLTVIFHRVLEDNDEKRWRPDETSAKNDAAQCRARIQNGRGTAGVAKRTR